MLKALFILIATAGFAQAALAESRIALVIGNGDYRFIGALDNPVSDASLMARTLADVGFEVTEASQSDQRAMKAAIADFGRALRAAGPDTVALFYYAGHAVQSFGNNYLLPVDAAIRDQADLDLVAVEADWILRQLRSARVRTSIVILDACRNNPFESVQGFDDEGLAEMNAPRGTFIAYATAPGMVAYDGTDGNSPFTAFLARAIQDTPKPIELMFKDVRINVVNATQGRQTPWDSSSLTEPFSFRPDEPTTEELALWNEVKTGDNPELAEEFLTTYPDSQFRDEAWEIVRGVLQTQRTHAIIIGPRDPPEQPESRPNPEPEPEQRTQVTFTTPLTNVPASVAGLTMEQIISGQGRPEFPPIEGLPDEVWKGQECTHCHEWNRERLCEQGAFYTTERGAREITKKHPLGGQFKTILRDWAASGCP